MVEVSVIVPARDAAQDIGACLDALAAQAAGCAYEVIVVDNGSRDGTAQLAEAHPLRPRVVHRARGEGPGAARNAGAQAAAGEVLAFTDADCRPRPGWLAAGVRALRRADLVQGAVGVPDGAAHGPFDHLVRVESEYGLYETASLFVRRAVFEAAGGFEDVIATGDGRPFGEDVWFAWRARRAGARTAFCAEARVDHVVAPGDWRGYLRERSRLAAFAELARRVPELRERFFFARWFFSRRSAAFDAALLSAVAAAARRDPRLLAGALPYAALLRRESVARTGVFSRRVAAVVAAGDVLTFAALVRGSLAARSPLL